jgi:hypothetical protein
MKTLLPASLATLTLMTSGTGSFAHDDDLPRFSSSRTGWGGTNWTGFQQSYDPRLGPGMGTVSPGWNVSSGSPFGPGGGFSNRLDGPHCGSGGRGGFPSWSPGYRSIYLPGPCDPVGHQVYCQPGRYVRVLDPWGMPRGW